MTSFPRNGYFFPLMTRETFAGLILDIVIDRYLLNISPWRLICFGEWAVVDGRMRCAPKKYERKEVDNPFPRSTTMAMETSKHSSAHETANELEEYKR